MTDCMSYFDATSNPGQTLKTDIMAQWIADNWIPSRPGPTWVTVAESNACAHARVTGKIDRAQEWPGGYTFAGEARLESDAVVNIAGYQETGETTGRTGAFIFRFEHTDGGDPVETLVMASYFTDQGHTVSLACVPEDFLATWAAFVKECDRLSGSLDPKPKVRIIGGRSESFVPTVDWDDIILPADLKDELMRDVESFFDKGIDVYRRLKLKPFRKLLLAGVPGTGKTMICSALAKWAIARDYLVIYVSSADYSGAAFWKIESALASAADSNIPALILLEELDAYVNDEEEKALVLNVLDGAEARENDLGTMLIATTNYPENIDERVLKRPGRLDRIFIIPETRTRDDAEDMLRYYLGDVWEDEHARIAKDLVGYPGAFIREVALYALTQMAYRDLRDLPLDLLKRSYDRLLDQITAKDDFLTRHRDGDFGFVTTSASDRRRNGGHNGSD